jgi:hypothetical protein
MDFHGEDPANALNDGDDGTVTASGSENRLQIRAYNHWVALLKGRPFPSVDDLDLDTIDIGPRSLLLDLTCGIEDPAITFVGKELREECGLGQFEIEYVSEVLRGSLLSRLTDHYLQILANNAPIGFEAEFTNERGIAMKYRGILMPFSSNGDTIDFICGSINWKTASGEDAGQVSPVAHNARLQPWLEPAGAEDVALSRVVLEHGAQLADWLAMAREGADAVRNADARSRSALYQTLGWAYDFAVAAETSPADYQELLLDSGMKVQARAPMTPVVKLVFGIDYDKGRLTEFASALSYGRRHKLPAGTFAAYLEGYDGGLKAIVQAERRERRPAVSRAPGDNRQRLRNAGALAFVELEDGPDEFVLLLGRRESSGRVAVLAPVKANEKAIERAIRDAKVSDKGEAGSSTESRAARLFTKSA